MSLKLVSDNSEPKIATEIAARARELADEIEAGTYGDVTRIALAIEFDGGLTCESWGEHIGPYDTMGLFEAAKLMTFADGASE